LLRERLRDVFFGFLPIADFIPSETNARCWRLIAADVMPVHILTIRFAMLAAQPIRCPSTAAI
jgi:hypothetical protein